MGIYIPDTFSSVGDAVVTGAASRLLDAYPGAAAAYSVRLLTSAYTGDCIRVRRASDNTEQDIGFDVNGDLDTAALTSFCTGTNGFVRTWYDQSGNANNATQTTTSQQPKIYDSSTGVLLTNSVAALNFDRNLSNNLSIPLTSSASDYGVFAVRNRSASGQGYLFDSETGRFIIEGNQDGLFYDGAWESGFITRLGQLQVSFILSATAGVYINGVLYKSTTYTQTAIGGTTRLGSAFIGTSSNFPGDIQEFIIYTSSQSANRSGIETNINNYYKIYIPYIYQLDEFDASGTWTKPANSIMHEVVVIGAGGGGASGSKQASGTFSRGGSGGGFGSVSWIHLLSSTLGATETVTIGAGGLGGAALTDGNNNTNGQTGSSGGNTSFGTHVGLDGGGGAAFDTGGSCVNWASAGSTPNTNRYVFSRDGNVGGLLSATATAPGSSGESQNVARNFSLPRTPSGGSITSGGTPTAGAGGAGTRILNNMNLQGLNVAAIGGAANIGVPGNGGLSNIGVYVGSGPIMWQTNNVGTMQYGASGGAGGSSTVGAGGRGGDPGQYGSGGAGGGASHNGPGRNSGAGGVGGGGCVKILSIIIPS